MHDVLDNPRCERGMRMPVTMTAQCLARPTSLTIAGGEVFYGLCLLPSGDHVHVFTPSMNLWQCPCLYKDGDVASRAVTYFDGRRAYVDHVRTVHGEDIG